MGGSFAAAWGLLLGALGHRLAAYVRWPERVPLGHVAVEVFLWAGALLAVGLFLLAMVVFRREVRAEKTARRRRQERRSLVRLVRRYAQDSQGRMNN